MPLQLGGLASGLDTDTVVAQLMALERRPQVKLKLKQRQVETRQTALRDVATRLRNLKAAAADLRSIALWADTQTVDSSDATRLTGRRVASAAPGAYQVEVSQLARAEQRTYDYTASTSDSSIDVSGVTVTIAASSTIEQAADERPGGRRGTPTGSGAVEADPAQQGASDATCSTIRAAPGCAGSSACTSRAKRRASSGSSRARATWARPMRAGASGPASPHTEIHSSAADSR